MSLRTTRSIAAKEAAPPSPPPAQTSDKAVAAPVERVKAHIEFNDVIPGLIIGSIFTWMSLMELGIFSYAVKTNNPSFASSYLDYKASDPVVSYILLALSLTLPVAIVQVNLAFLRIFTHKASKIIHFFDFVHFAALMTVVYLIVAKMGPGEGAVKEAGLVLAQAKTAEAVASATAALTAAVRAMGQPQLVMFVCNVVMLFLPCFRLKEANAAKAMEAIKKRD